MSPARRFLPLTSLASVALFSAACSSSGGSGGAEASGGAFASGGGSNTSGQTGGASTGGGNVSSGGSDRGTGGVGEEGASGGLDGTGATPAGGGQPTSGGAPGVGGAAGGTSGGSGGGSGGTNTTPIDCTLTTTATVSTAVGSVVTVTLESDLEGVSGGHIEFGRDTTYGLDAPVDLTAEGLRTLLLGMPFGTEVHYRVALRSPVGTCTGPDQVISTTAAPSGVPTLQVTASDPSLVTPGFVVVGIGSWATIWNHLGELVWAYKVVFNGVTRFDFSYDGLSLIARDGNPSGSRGAGIIRRLSLDGTSDEAIQLDRSHHDFTTTPDNGMVFFVNSEDNCGKLVKMADDGTFSDLFTVAEAFDTVSGSGGDLCHMNSLHYHEFDDSITFSVLNKNAYVKISGQGDLQWVLGGGDESDFSGDGADWNRQHGHMMIDDSHLLFFNNRSGSESALIVEVELNHGAKTATKTFEYDGGGKSMTLGDVQELPSGNRLVTYCNDGLQRELTPDQAPVRDFKWSTGVGYATHRPTLYGPPPAR